MNQTVSLYEFSTVERACSPECQANCLTGEASAIYDPCGNLISLVAQTTGAEVWARAVDKNSDSTIGIYNPYNMEIPFSAQATINPSYDQPINGPIEFQIPEQGQWELKELLANLTKANTTIGENGVDATIGGDDDCPAGEGDCGDSVGSCDYDRCQVLWESSDGEQIKHNYEPSEYNCTLIFCCKNLYGKALDNHFKNHEKDDQHSPVAIPSDSSGTVFVKFLTAARRTSTLYDWCESHQNDCEKWVKNKGSSQ